MADPTPCAPRAAQDPARPTVGDIFRRFGDSFCASHSLSAQQHKVFSDIQRCRTPALGGHIAQCDSCGYNHLFLNSCRNRHCPSCQSLAQKEWLEQRSQRLLPCPYFHVVFTLPAELRSLVMRYRALLLALLFEAATKTLLCFGQDQKHLGAQLGITAVLHTWTRTLEFHPHLHCIVTAGGLSKDGSAWLKPSSPKFLFPVLALSLVFRGKFLDKLQTLFANGKLPSLSKSDFASLLASLVSKPWVVYAKRPFGGAKALYSYLGRYTHRTGISNQRLLRVDSAAVVFRTRDNKSCSVAPTEFIRRFLLHVLPPHFTKIRHYGLLASANVNGRLEQARSLLLAAAPPPPLVYPAPADSADPTLADPTLADPTPADPAAAPGLRCPRCRRCLMRPVASLHDLGAALVSFFAALADLCSRPSDTS